MSRLHCAGKWKAICAYKHNYWLLQFRLDDVVSSYWLNFAFKLSFIVPWQIYTNAAGCEYSDSIKGMWQTWSMLLVFVSILNIFVDTADFSVATDSVCLFTTIWNHWEMIKGTTGSSWQSKKRVHVLSTAARGHRLRWNRFLQPHPGVQFGL